MADCRRYSRAEHPTIRWSVRPAADAVSRPKIALCQSFYWHRAHARLFLDLKLYVLYVLYTQLHNALANP